MLGKMREVISLAKGKFAISFILTVIYSGVVVVQLYLASAIVDTAIAGDMEKVLIVVGLNLLAWIISLTVDYFKNSVNNQIIAKVNDNTRSQINKELENYDYVMFQSHDLGNYLSWYNYDVTQIENKVTKQIFTFFSNITMLIVSFVTICMMDISLMLIVVISLLVMTFAPNLFQKKMEKWEKNLAKGNEDFTHKLQDAVQGFETCLIFTRLPWMSKKINQASESFESLRANTNDKMYLTDSVISFINILLQIGVNLLTAYLIVQGKLNAGSILMIGSLSAYFFQSAGSLSQIILVFKAGYSLLEKHLKKAEHEEKTSVNQIQNLSLENVQMKYDDKLIGKAMTLSFEKGKKYAIVGESGCGKSTLCRLLIGFHKDYEGNFYVDGKDGKEIDLLRSGCMYISQTTQLFNETILQNITLGENYSREEVLKVIEDSGLNEYIATLPKGIDTVVEENGKNMSGGQRQRLALARALLRKEQQSFMIFDEATSALDKKTAQFIESKILENKNLGVIMITHHMNECLKAQLDEVVELTA